MRRLQLRRRKSNLRVQFEPEQFYIPPFTQQRTLSPEGREVYEPIEAQQAPTGVWLLDDCLRLLSKGRDATAMVQKHYGLSAEVLSSAFYALTGRTYVEVRDAMRLRIADDLLRYTDLPVSEVAHRAGYGTPQFYARVVHRAFGLTPTARRAALRRKGDLGRYAL